MAKYSFSLAFVAIFIGIAESQVVTNAPVSSGGTPVPAPVVVPVPAPTVPSNLDYLTAAELKWTTSLPQGTTTGQLNTGNAVTGSPDGVFVYVTRDNGRLDVLQASDGAQVFNYTPEPIESGWTVTCSSGVVFGTFFQTTPFVAYAIVDKPPLGSGFESKSRIVTFKVVTTPEWWYTSAEVSGKIIGTPVISNSYKTVGSYIFVTHNINTDSTTTTPSGYFTVFSTVDGSVMFSEGSDASSTDDLAPYSALGVASNPLFGKYPGGETNQNDVLAWISTRDDGTDGEGYTRAFQIPAVFDSTTNTSTTILRTVRWNGVARPTLTKDGQALFAVVRESGVRGWVGGTDFDEIASWQQVLTKNDISGTPIQNAATISVSQSFLFVTASAAELGCINALTGDIVWQTASSALYTSEPKVSLDDFLVFGITADGTLGAYTQTDGSVFWSATCASLNVTTCSNFVNAEFSVSANGMVVYYGDIDGNVKAVQVAFSTVPTAAPTTIPGTSSSPVSNSTAPVSTSTAPVSISTPPAASNPPLSISTAPVSNTAPPVASIPPLSTTTSPVSITTPPVVSTPPLSTTTSPVSTTTSPVATTVAPSVPTGMGTSPPATSEAPISIPPVTGPTVPASPAPTAPPSAAEVSLEPSPAPSTTPATPMPVKTTSGGSKSVYSCVASAAVVGMTLLMK